MVNNISIKKDNLYSKVSCIPELATVLDDLDKSPPLQTIMPGSYTDVNKLKMLRGLSKRRRQNTIAN